MATATTTSQSKRSIQDQLRAYLLSRYLPRNSLKNQGKCDPIRVDDCCTKDITDWKISVRIPDDMEMFLLQIDDIPYNPSLIALVEAKDGRVSQQPEHEIRMQIPVKFSDARWLRKLSKQIQKVTGRGQRYTNPNWKWMSRRAANSIQELAIHLQDFRFFTE